ncbi:Putative F-box protein [Striga hermonthica]|uniref:F-box protein n=1 Tax=Striga hermonthica TaxID=68872 RepID=A0A9N7N2U2_STRHE|nr:Putative F-box protein [Striga hermonthica]
MDQFPPFTSNLSFISRPNITGFVAAPRSAFGQSKLQTLLLAFMAGRRVVNLDSKFGPNKCVERYHGDDLVSRLPDDILLVILYSLPLKEAERTSVLSSRWRNLWSYTSYLNFDNHRSMEKIIQDPDFRYVEREKYVSEAIEFLLRYCPLLEHLVVHCSEILSSLEVCGPSLALKHLKIRHCSYLKSLRISAPILTTLILDKIEGLLLEGVPMLRDVYVTFGDAWPDSMFVQRLVPTLLCCLSQLEILTLNILLKKEILPTLNFPVMPKLRKLVFMKVLYGVDFSLLDLARLIKASPNLEEFELKQTWFEPERSNREIQKGVKHFPLHQHLNVFRFLGYYGCPSDVELVNYLLENCVALKEIIVYAQDPHRRAYEAVDPEELKLADKAKIYAKQQLEPLHGQLVEGLRQRALQTQAPDLNLSNSVPRTVHMVPAGRATRVVILRPFRRVWLNRRGPSRFYDGEGKEKKGDGDFYMGFSRHSRIL